jgi:hypothetical protein
MNTKVLKKTTKSVKDFITWEILYPVTNFAVRYYKRFKRSFDYAKFGYSNYDWDHSYLYALLAFKLDRVHKELINGYAVQDSKDMEALKEAKAICDRLREGNYEDKYIDLHEAKWGELKLSFIDQGNGLSRMDSSRSKVLTPKDEKQSRKELSKLYKQAVKDEDADIKRLGEILLKYSREWWE